MLLIDRCQRPSRQMIGCSSLTNPASLHKLESSPLHGRRPRKNENALEAIRPGSLRPPAELLLIIMTNIIYANVIRGRREHDRRAQGAAGNSPGSKHSIKILNSTGFNLSVINKAAGVTGCVGGVKFHHRRSTQRRFRGREREREREMEMEPDRRSWCLLRLCFLGRSEVEQHNNWCVT